MTKRTVKVGIVGKYGTRYGASLRRIIKKFEVQQHSRYVCSFCGKKSVRRTVVGIWHCKACGKNCCRWCLAIKHSPAIAAKSTLIRLKKLREEGEQ